MPLLKPCLMVDKMIDLDMEFFRSVGCKAILLDVDNTMTTHDNPTPAQGVMEWIDSMKNNGLKLIIVSNNSAERVAPFAEKIGLDFVAKGAKPLAKGFKEACRRIGVKPKEAVAIGDQIYTDIIGGNLLGAYTVLTVPYELEDKAFFKFKRAMEKPVISSYRRKAARKARKNAD